MLFRVTRGHAVVTPFNLVVHNDDKIRDDKYEKDRTGYIVLIEDTPQMRDRVFKVCSGFVMGEEWKVFSVKPRDVQEQYTMLNNEKALKREQIAVAKQALYDYTSHLRLDDYSLLGVYD